MRYLFFFLAELSLSYGMQNLVPWPVVESRPPSLGAQSLNRWTTREILWVILLSTHLSQVSLTHKALCLPPFKSQLLLPFHAHWVTFHTRPVFLPSLIAHELSKHTCKCQVSSREVRHLETQTLRSGCSERGERQGTWGVTETRQVFLDSFPKPHLGSS